LYQWNSMLETRFHCSCTVWEKLHYTYIYAVASYCMQTFSAIHSCKRRAHEIRIRNGKLTHIKYIFRSIAHRVAVDWSIFKHHGNHWCCAFCRKKLYMYTIWCSQPISELGSSYNIEEVHHTIERSLVALRSTHHLSLSAVPAISTDVAKLLVNADLYGTTNRIQTIDEWIALIHQSHNSFRAHWDGEGIQCWNSFIILDKDAKLNKKPKLQFKIKGRQRRAEFACTYGHNREVYLERWPGKRQELLFDTDKPLIALYIALGCLDG
jgi:hypothetical protein